MSKLRGRCRQCGKRSIVRNDGQTRLHRCLLGRRGRHKAVDVETFEWRVNQFVRDILPADASQDRITAAIRLVTETFRPDLSALPRTEE